MENKKLLNDTKTRFQLAYRYSGISRQDFNDMLYYMNILAILKDYPYETTAEKLNDMIENGEY